MTIPSDSSHSLQQSRLAALSASVAATTPREHEALVTLEKLLVQSRIDEPAALTPRELSIERTTWFAAENVPADRQKRLDHLVQQAPPDQAPIFRVFRREVPVAAPMLDLSAPSWGRGARAEHSLGPFRGVDGRLFWFDFFRIVRLVRLYLAGDARPAMLFRERDRTRVVEKVTNQHTLVKSSVWLRADLLAAGAPAGGYVGLLVEGGRIRFSGTPTGSAGQLILPPGASCTVDLKVSPSQAPAAPPGTAGRDAAAAELSTPDTLSFLLGAGHATPTDVTDAVWKVYGTRLHLERAVGTPPTFEPLLQSVLIPMKPAESRLIVTTSQSPFAVPRGEADIRRAGWTLPVSVIDVDHPTEAGGGGLAVQTGDGLALTWRGLRDGPVRLPAPWLAGGPGLIVLIDPAASNLYAHQRLLLWKDADSKLRSEMQLRYTSAFAVSYASAATGHELLVAQTNVEARLDRPVDVKGTPFQIRTQRSLLSLAYADDAQLAFVYDDDILADSLAPAAMWSIDSAQTRSLAIRNALFTITPINSLLLFAALEDDETVSRATLMLGMGLYGLLPTLPDPYAANVTWLRGQTRDSRRQARPEMLLVASTAWTRTTDAADFDAVSMSFAFAPLAPRQQVLSAWTDGADRQSEIDVAREGALVSNQRDWDRHFSAFDNEQFALLDVSSNADQMGVSFAWSGERPAEETDLVFYQLYKPTAAGTQPFPLQIQHLDLSAQSRHVRVFTLPQISWEPAFNLTHGTPPRDPPPSWNLYPNDGGPTRLFNDSVALVPIAPIPVTELLVTDFNDRAQGTTGALFTLPFGLRAFAQFSRTNPSGLKNAPARLGLFRPQYEGGALRGALQLRADAPAHPVKSPTFEGATLQLNNVLDPSGAPTGAGTLGFDVAKIFNQTFYYDSPLVKTSGVPLSRIDFSGYGANIFSHWEDPSAVVAAPSKAYFDVFGGRTAEEVIQVRSLLYPWGVRVVRTISLTRASDGYVFRFDTGWQAQSEGIYDFRYNVSGSPPRSNPYEFHPGLVKGVFNVRNIRETTAVIPFERVWNKKPGDEYLDNEGVPHLVDGLTLAEFRSPPVFLQPVYFDADVAIDFVISGAAGGRVPSKGLLGYVQLAPRGEPISANLFTELLAAPRGSLGGPVDCVIDIGKTGQQMRLSRVDVNTSTGTAGPTFVGAARGALILPKEGAWSVVQHDQGSGEVSPLDPQAAVPLIRRGKLLADATGTDASAADLMRIANPVDLVGAPRPGTRNYALLQSTNTQKALFRLPSFQEGVKELQGAPPDFADAYRLVNSKSIFPNVANAIPLNLGPFKTTILPGGYKLADALNPGKLFEQPLVNGPLFLVNEKFVKLYVEYSSVSDGMLSYGFDATAAGPADQWQSNLSNISMVVDLGSIERLMMIKGKLASEKGATPGFRSPELQFNPKLQPLIDILQVLSSLQTGDYKAAFEHGLDIAMSNSADSWTYAFHARKDIPALRFPPGVAFDNPTNPLKLEARMALGVYFNEALAMTSAPNQLVPSAGAFLEFTGSLSVMCVSLAVATVYAVGSVELRMAADIKAGPSLHMKFGFGAEIAVGLPVIGTVSLLYMVGVQIDVQTGSLTVAAFLLYRGRAELIGGLISVQIQIEAQGIVKERVGAKTEMAAQITFGLDISLFLVINLHFSTSWEESRQIA